MSSEIKGLDRLIKKLDKLSRIESKQAVEEVGKLVEKQIRASASSFSDTEYRHIAKCEARDYGSSYFVDVGLKNDKVPFELWKGLWFHNWGYRNMGRGGIYNGMYINMHVMWFDSAVQQVGPTAKRQLKAKLQAEVKAALR